MSEKENYMAKDVKEEGQSVEDIAKKVITPTRKYFLPSEGKTVEAESLAEAIKKENK